jgi:amino-acid N-acetyltransferase
MELRKATVQDVAAMQGLIQYFANLGLMLPRTEKSLYENLQSFSVATLNDQVVGTAGLHILWKDLAEIRSLAVDPNHHGLGIGRLLVEHLVQEAEALGISQVLSLTYQTKFFDKLGFQVVRKETLPHKIWKDCIHCKKFTHCDEVAMVYYTQRDKNVDERRVMEG